MTNTSYQPTTEETSISRRVLSVTQLNRQAQRLLEDCFPDIWIEGEISNLTQHRSGHWYFSLKDDNAQVSCAMFKNRNFRVAFNPKQGMSVLIQAKASLYPARGNFQLIVNSMEEAGVGALQRQFEQLKQKLDAEGLFASQHKKALPSLPQHIAVITSPTGAAIKDILAVLKRRFPAIPITLIPTTVQGKQGTQSIINSIQQANNYPFIVPVDVLVVGRGGGSLEDLWCFNEESVARAIFASNIPIISAVGHEIDFTIADFVADKRAPTPSAAAEIAVPDRYDWLAQVESYSQRLTQLITSNIRGQQQTVHHLQQRLRHPKGQLQEKAQRLDDLEARLLQSISYQLTHQQQQLKYCIAQLQANSPQKKLQQQKQQLQQLQKNLQQAVVQQLQLKKQRLGQQASLLNAVSPLATLDRGYAIAKTHNKELLRSISQTAQGDSINTQVSDGIITSQVTSITPIKSVAKTHKKDSS